MKKSTILRNDSPHTVTVREGTHVAEHKPRKANVVQEAEDLTDHRQKIDALTQSPNTPDPVTADAARPARQARPSPLKASVQTKSKTSAPKVAPVVPEPAPAIVKNKPSAKTQGKAKPIAPAAPVTAPLQAPQKSAKPKPGVSAPTAKKAAPRKAPTPAGTPKAQAAVAQTAQPVLDDALLWEQDSPVLARLAQLKNRNAALEEQLQRLKSPLPVRGKKP